MTYNEQPVKACTFALSGMSSSGAPVAVESQHSDVIHSIVVCHHNAAAFAVLATEAGVQIWDKSVTHLLHGKWSEDLGCYLVTCDEDGGVAVWEAGNTAQRQGGQGWQEGVAWWTLWYGRITVNVTGYTFYQSQDYDGTIYPGADLQQQVYKLSNETNAQYYVRLSGACSANCSCAAFNTGGCAADGQRHDRTATRSPQPEAPG
eukprot:XP_001699362.1 predicted protein [Chlamydomonas reinhardtii]